MRRFTCVITGTGECPEQSALRRENSSALSGKGGID
jgi:hypothetical protein